MSTHISCKARGFTLIELLTVLGILALLAGILFAVFSRVRESGRRAVCQSNLHQISLAVRQYVQDNDGRFPAIAYTINKNTAQAKRIAWNDALTSYLKNKDVLRCPTSEISERDHDTDYIYNWMRVNHIIWSPDKSSVKNEIAGSHESTASQFSTIWLNTDMMWKDAEDNYFYGYIAESSCGRKFWGGNLHGGGANYSFLDGHVKWLTPEQMAEIECQNGLLPAPFSDIK